MLYCTFLNVDFYENLFGNIFCINFTLMTIVKNNNTRLPKLLLAEICMEGSLSFSELLTDLGKWIILKLN